MRLSSIRTSALAALLGAGFLTAPALAVASSLPGVFGSAGSKGPVGGDFDVGSMTASASRSTITPSSAGFPSTSSRSSLSLDESARFSMNQSYSLTALSGPQGSASSGLYLNTLNYRFTPLLTAFFDVGFHTPLHSSLPGMDQAGGAGSLVLPRAGLEYRPSERLTFNVEVINGPDAWKAWGASSSAFSPIRSFSGSRIP